MRVKFPSQMEKKCVSRELVQKLLIDFTASLKTYLLMFSRQAKSLNEVILMWPVRYCSGVMDYRRPHTFSQSLGSDIIYNAVSVICVTGNASYKYLNIH